MKLSASMVLMFREHDPLDRPAAARRAGFEGIELQDIALAPTASLRTAIEDAGIPVVLLNVPSGDIAQGGPGLSGVAGREAAFADAFAQALDVAGALGTRTIHLAPSRAVAGDIERGRAVLASNIDRALSVSGDAATLLVEPMNRIDMPDALFHAVGDIAAFLDRHGFDDRVGILFDAYHVAMNGASPADELRRVRHRVKHIQFSDAPGRHQPGSGDIDFAPVIRCAADLDYDGWWGAEYVPAGATGESLAWMARFRSRDRIYRYEGRVASARRMSMPR